ncbi:hypothetical protein MTR67_024372 [Solanum verrucosum]|uniref:SAP domain-containing protein n=2 Tax=Solanum TaxID=4107 RepID=A0AAF0QV84_SOLVR|nr:hypothetical protein MTR67_024372 [Solanum verrucosum]
MAKYQKDIQRKQRKVLKLKKDEVTVEHSIFFCTSIPRRSRKKTSIKQIVKNGQKFNPSTSWLDYKKESKKKNSKDLDQMGDNWYSVPLSEYDIPDSFPNDLDELLWDKDVFDFMNDIPNFFISIVDTRTSFQTGLSGSVTVPGNKFKACSSFHFKKHKGNYGQLHDAYIFSFREMKTKDNGNVICSLPGLPKKKLQDLCKKHGLSPYKTKPNLVSSLVPYIKGADELLFKEMKTKDNGNSINRLPKKGLQDLCRKHGLSPYKTKPNLVSSLVPYIKGADELLFKEMKTKDNGNSINRLPKKGLQDLCRKHGLSPYKTKPNLVSSLVPYIKGADELLFKEMKTKDNGNSINRLPKKELQDLCRKHGLSPYKTKPNLVNSLITYVKGAESFSFKEMKTKDNGNSIYSLRKKKLQELCKKYGLSPHKTKPNLVNSLVNYFKVNVGFRLMIDNLAFVTRSSPNYLIRFVCYYIKCLDALG